MPGAFLRKAPLQRALFEWFLYKELLRLAEPHFAKGSLLGIFAEGSLLRDTLQRVALQVSKNAYPKACACYRYWISVQGHGTSCTSVEQMIKSKRFVSMQYASLLTQCF